MSGISVSPLPDGNAWRFHDGAGSPLAHLALNHWESKFFCRRHAAAELDFLALQDSDLLAQVLAAVARCVDAEGIALTELRVPAEHVRTVPDLERVGFRLVETRVEIRWHVHKASMEKPTLPDGDIRWASETDLPVLVELTKSCFVDEPGFYGRFNHPHYYSPEDAARYYSAWLVDNLQRDDHRCAVLEKGGEIVGYHLTSRVGSRDGEPCYRGLLAAVAPAHRGNMILRALRSFMFASLDAPSWYYESATPLPNLGSVARWARQGARLSGAGYIFYRACGRAS